ncbi:MAG: RNA-binding protein [Lachnospiraceae bacterium]|jgi:predicted RNA-binding protein (virulence factor B family)|nr:RNA-binding protein [Lachnospiraceae bacterium]
MIRLGEKQTLSVVKEVEFGIYLAATKPDDQSDLKSDYKSDFQSTGHPASDERILLPQKQVPMGTSMGDSLTVFVYRDSDDRMIATTNTPRITIGEVGRLRVVETTAIGAFLDWGLERDLFLPFREQTRMLNADEEVNVAVYLDKSDRLAATMKIYHYLATDSPYQKNDMVTGEIYEISGNFGIFVAVDHIYSALIPGDEAKDPTLAALKVGDTVTARVSFVKPDGKLDITLREPMKLRISSDAERIISIITAEYQGVLPFNDKAPPEKIQAVFAMSKSDFKRAVGNLLKSGRISIAGNSIHII